MSFGCCLWPWCWRNTRHYTVFLENLCPIIVSVAVLLMLVLVINVWLAGNQTSVTHILSVGANAHLFREKGVFNYSTMLLREDLDLMVLGARESVYALDLKDISKKLDSVRTLLSRCSCVLFCVRTNFLSNLSLLKHRKIFFVSMSNSKCRHADMNRIQTKKSSEQHPHTFDTVLINVSIF